MSRSTAEAWAKRCAAAAVAHPTSALRSTGLAPHFDDPQVTGAIFRDLLRFDAERGSEGQREGPGLRAGMEALREMMGDHFCMDPFHLAFERLAGGRSDAHLANTTGLSRSTVQRLRSGEARPTRDHLVTVARTLGKDPRWFVEYRAILLAEAVASEALRSPERSAVLVGKLR